ncbi:hypothetical protein BGZ46_002046 [Entomortierella lignicola]|nr:hypothetical protein BGZ46_002046 [Entomortierella lignicola]
MLWKIVIALAAVAAPALAYEPVTCTRVGTFHNVTEINADGTFCTMLPPYGTQEVAPAEGCANSYCFGSQYTNTSSHLVGPADFILSVNYVNNATNQFTQITGCIDSTKWGLNPTDEGGQMDSHGWMYSCANSKKFVSLLEPATNTYCIRCCNGPNFETDCDTSHSTNGCWNLIPGLYTLSDGTSCPPPAGAPNSTTPANSTTSGVVSGTATATALPTGVTGATTSGAAAGSGTSGSATSASGSQPTVAKSAGSRLSFSMEAAGVAVVAVLAAAAF